MYKVNVLCIKKFISLEKFVCSNTCINIINIIYKIDIINIIYKIDIMYAFFFYDKLINSTPLEMHRTEDPLSEQVIYK